MPRNLDLPLIGIVAAALVVALVVALVATPVVKNLAIRVKAVDVPKDGRRMHDHPIPRMGGLAIFLGFLLSVLLFLDLNAQMRGMLLGAVIPIFMYIAPAIASFLVATVCVECGKTLAWTAYGAVSLLSLLFVPDKEVALTFVFLLGYYPLVKPKFEHIRPALLRGLCKLLLCNGGILLMYGLVLLLIPGGSISQEMRTTALAVSLTTLAMGNVAFLLYDRALHNMLQAYRILWQPRLHKMLGR